MPRGSSGQSSRQAQASEELDFLTGGTQGVQFAAVGGHLLEFADQHGVGNTLDLDWFVQEIRN